MNNFNFGGIMVISDRLRHVAENRDWSGMYWITTNRVRCVGLDLSRTLRAEPSQCTGATQNKEFKVIVPRVVPRSSDRSLRRIPTSSKHQEEIRMKRHTSRNSHRDEKPKPSRNEDSDAVLHARTEEERRRRRREWMIEHEKMDRHNRLKRKMIMEYEIRRARNMSLAFPEGRCNIPRRSRSESPPSRYRRTSAHHTPECTVLSKKFETSSGTTPLFKGSEGTKISSTELRKIKVDIHRNIPGRVSTNELKRDIPNKEDVVLTRRAGEGCKPIFDREDIKRAISETEEVEEHRTVVTVNLENSENKLKTLKRHSGSLSPTRTRNHSPRCTWSRHPRFDDSKHEDEGSYRSDREKDHSREWKDGERSYRHHRERRKNYSRDRRQTNRSRERDRPREHRVPGEHYIRPIPVPIYYGNFQPRPLMVGPWVPIRGPLGGDIQPPMMRPLRTFPPRREFTGPFLDCWPPRWKNATNIKVSAFLKTCP
ncbi:uncharacterized protein LOC143367615 isoform X2 [Andrena cerasifolii]|uniref:uncharacterized protein LOC143367615 isoform X2 n=1 Tax=Andrena cerasifolii TaxID=2819439 RepID=UPI0040381EE9